MFPLITGAERALLLMSVGHAVFEKILFVPIYISYMPMK